MKKIFSSRLARRVRQAFSWWLLTVALVAPASAQEAPPASPPAGGSSVVQMTRPLWTEAAITVVMVGLALYAVCRNSNRT